MSHYLVVAHQTATSPELLNRARSLAADDREARFTLLIPATHPTHLLHWDPDARFTWDEHTTYEIARDKAAEARAYFERHGLRVERTLIGDASPVLTIEDELRLRPDDYDSIIISTLPHKHSRWLAGGIAQRAQNLGLPVILVGTELPAPRPSRLRLPVPARVQQLLQGGERDAMIVIGLLAVAYIAGGLLLAANVDRGFILNDVVAIIVFSIMLGSLAFASIRRSGHYG